MPPNHLTQRPDLKSALDAFLLDRKARGVSPGTLTFYRAKIRALVEFCAASAVTEVEAITPDLLRRFLLELEKTHNPGGVHAAFRATRTFLRWFEFEFGNGGTWRNPIRKVKAPRVALEPLEPVSLATVEAVLEHCGRWTFTGDRDRAMLLCLLDTGARAGEFLALDLADVNAITGAIVVRRGKGGKSRHVFIGQKPRRARREATGS